MARPDTDSRGDRRVRCLEPSDGKCEEIEAELRKQHPDWSPTRCWARAKIVWYLRNE